MRVGKEKFWMWDKDLASVETLMTSYCLMLPLVSKTKFAGEFTYVYSDWDVNGVEFEKILPCLCRIVFACNVSE